MQSSIICLFLKKNPMKYLILCFSLIAFFSCEKAQKNYVSIEGTVTNPNSDSLLIRSRSYNKVIRLDANNSFSDSLKVEPGFYMLFDGSEAASIFLKNGYELKLTIDAKAFDETINFSGRGAEQSNFLAKKTLLEEELLNIDALSELDEEELKSSFIEIKSELENFYKSSKDIDSLIVSKGLNEIEPMLGAYERYLGESIALKKALPKGSKSPSFENFENINGSSTSLTDLEGKYTYIDIWATWCGPCKREIPFLKSLEEEYHGKNIQFASISIDDDRSHNGSWEKAKSDWKAMVNDKNLTGIQLFAPNGWQTEFIKAYKINGIPRFILLDPEGNIVNPDAPRPSSPKLKSLFKDLNI